MRKRRPRQDTLLFRDSPVPRYAQLSTLLRGRIERGEWPAGTQIPTLEALVETFGVARVTARQAIALLAREGLVRAERGRGTFVTGSASSRGRLRLATTLTALADLYRDDAPKLTLVDEASAMPRLAAEDGTPAPRYRYLRRVHSRGGEAYCAISIFLDERVFRMAPARFRRHTVIPVLLDLPGIRIARAWQTLAIGAADVEVARLIGMPVNAPVALVRRVCVDASGTVIYLGEITYRGDYIHLEMDLKP
ncbi:MAG: GntR family transcriptional regulator [Burkholderiales bacterium]|jgi:GntR family transcriptional regulator|nr:GntR family transcriptional regulator [Burkholderiales bacterium]